jgi:hypothetical protein
MPFVSLVAREFNRNHLLGLSPTRRNTSELVPHRISEAVFGLGSHYPVRYNLALSHTGRIFVPLVGAGEVSPRRRILSLRGLVVMLAVIALTTRSPVGLSESPSIKFPRFIHLALKQKYSIVIGTPTSAPSLLPIFRCCGLPKPPRPSSLQNPFMAGFNTIPSIIVPLLAASSLSVICLKSAVEKRTA